MSPSLEINKPPVSLWGRFFENARYIPVRYAVVSIGLLSFLYLFTRVDLIGVAVIVFGACMAELFMAWIASSVLITQLRLTEKGLVLHFLRSSAKVEAEIPVETLSVVLQKRYGRSNKNLKLRILQAETLLLEQRACTAWSNAELWAIYAKVKEIKKEDLTKEDETLRRVCVENQPW